MTAGGGKPPLAAIFGCSGLTLSHRERAFFKDSDPAGFILFARNVESPEQVRALVRELRGCAGRPDAFMLIDQEGGRVARLGPPHWRAAPAAGRFADLATRDMARACRAAWLNSRLLADDLAKLEITVDCLPVLDLRLPGAHDIVGDRSYGADPETVSALGRAVCDGLLAGGVLPVIKHIPGHGRATADSHHDLPTVEAALGVLEDTDFAPFRALADMPMAMTAHILYPAVDADRPATTSRTAVDRIIRGAIGFDGLLMTDDLSMKALGGTPEERTARSLDAGCDVVLHCNGDIGEMTAIAGAARTLDSAGQRRLAHAHAMVRAPERIDRGGALAELDTILDTVDQDV